MQIVLRQGEKVEVTFADTDGIITVDYDYNRENKLTVTTDLPDSSGRQGEIYCENFGECEDFGSPKWGEVYDGSE